MSQWATAEKFPHFAVTKLITGSALASPERGTLFPITTCRGSSPAPLLCDMQKEPKVNSALFVRQRSPALPSDRHLILFGSLFILREPFVTCG